ncbi:MAG: RIP metalloprotease RseP [Muribaculaceae bacterium]
METFLIKAVQLVAALSLLVIIHEFGHYIFARIFGIRAEKFYLFWNPYFSLVRYNPRTGKWNFFCRNLTDEEEKARIKEIKESKAKASWRDTIYGIGWLPLGGYVSIGGMIDERMDTNQVKETIHPTDFMAKPAWQRFFVMVGGVLFNFILAILIYAGIAFGWGEKYIEYTDAYAGMDFIPEAQAIGFQNGDIPLTADGKQLSAGDDNSIMQLIEAKEVTVLRGNDTIAIAIPENFILKIADKKMFMSYRLPVIANQIMPGDPAEKAGLQPGDHIIAIGETPTPSYTEFMPALQVMAGKECTIKVLRNEKEISLTATPTEGGKLGFTFKMPTDIYKVNIREYGFFESFPKGISDGCSKLVAYVSSLKYVFTKEGAQSVGGFGAIGSLFPEQWSWLMFWEITAFLSVILAFMNILPIPALDGGHIMFVLWEMITGKPASLKVLEYAQMVGMALLFALLIYANANDIYRFFIK